MTKAFKIVSFHKNCSIEVLSKSAIGDDDPENSTWNSLLASTAPQEDRPGFFPLSFH